MSSHRKHHRATAADRMVSYIRRHHWGMLATLVALSGTAYAAATVGPSDIERGPQSAHRERAGQAGRPGAAGPSGERRPGIAGLG
jgi:hypothetical protein